MVSKIPFTKYESVILLYYYLKVVSGDLTRLESVKKCSGALRSLAVNSGVEIDDLFRNVGGISLQMAAMESAYRGETILKPASKLFQETVWLYRNDNSSYQRLLEEALGIAVPKQNAEEVFLKWLSEKAPPALLSDLYLAIQELQAEAIRLELVNKSLFEDSNAGLVKRLRFAIDRDRYFKMSHSRQMGTIYSALKYLGKYYGEHEIPICNLTEEKSLQKDEADNINKPTVGKEGYSKLPSIVDFTSLADFAQTKPLYANYFGESIYANSCSWRDLYVEVIKLLIDDYPTDLTAARDDPHNLVLHSLSQSHYMSKPVIIADEFCVETMKSTGNLLGDLRLLLDICRVDYENLEIAYVENSDVSSQESSSFTENVKRNESVISVLERRDGWSGTAQHPVSGVRDEKPTGVYRGIADVLSQHYKYGFRFDSIRELMRFRQFAAAMGVDLPDDDIELKEIILSCGTVIQDKLFCRDDNMSTDLQRTIDSIFSSGVRVVYYECLFENEAEWMEAHAISSPEMLKEYLQNDISGYTFSKKFMVKGVKRPESDVVTDEIMRVWGDRVLEKVDYLHERLPYIPLSNIWRVISGNIHFALSAEGEYLRIDRFSITGDEEDDILDFVNGECEDKGFASLSDIPLGDIEEENYELSQSAILGAIYKRVLSGRFHINGKILTKEKTDLDILTLLKQFIDGKDECDFIEVANKVIELTGSTNRQYAFQALYDEMVRVSKERYVASRYVDFPVEEIDSALSNFVADGFCAIKDVTTFAIFPLCGQSWNHYLLESYCYRYSREFDLLIIRFNDKNAGIIKKNDLNLTYDEILALVLARSDVELTLTAAGQFLSSAGYLAKSKYGRLEDILQKAADLRDKR